ncbi:tRNA(fMet)-specific endonuclease VapC [Aquisphaera giovannonii]|uniref:Ribonuclease VapC n=1 Tax=Aquisphaera giovannonii TaxID=406548 RepID=A0A5B9W598_9BACT|nr:PIN domain-containing protein [Aquisphaera giovannonii]QEH35211.1 tRNA(fMet)-specific endonuclease VapC [Aquisphaera giovannonii]
MNRALLDTDIYSEILKGIDQTVRANAIAYRTQHGVLTLSAVTLMEIAQGHHQRQASRQLLHFLASVAVEEVLPFDRDTAELAGRIAGELERVGQPIGTADPMIAAIALHHGLELVTGNTGHFQRIQQIGYPLILVNWR